MRKVVSGGPANSMAPKQPFRPFGYNLVELSRFAVGAFPLVFQSRARLLLGGPSPTLSGFGYAFAPVLPFHRSCHDHSQLLHFDELTIFS
jgi:hypothetical protein